jgi:hypothetical protein
LKTGASSIVERCPFGMAGERLYVRETFLPMKSRGGGTGVLADSIAEATYVCFPDGGQMFRDRGYFPWTLEEPPNPRAWPKGARWRPSMHMPRWASRIKLENVDVILQRIQDMTEADAHAEGVADRSEFAAAWDQTYPAAAVWDWNPWIWGIRFRVLKGGPR